LNARFPQQLGKSCLGLFTGSIFGTSGGDGDGSSVIALLATVVEGSALSRASLLACRRVGLEAR
jgi:hypothetical protein